MRRVIIYHYGRIKEKNYAELSGYYASLCSKAFAVEFRSLKDPGVKVPASSLPKADHAKLIMMNEKGREITTPAFCSLISERFESESEVSFVVGNAWGFAPDAEVLVKAKLALSQLIFPHEMAIMVLCEQLFRAADKMSGGKYTK